MMSAYGTQQSYLSGLLPNRLFKNLSARSENTTSGFLSESLFFVFFLVFAFFSYQLDTILPQNYAV